MGTSLKKCPFLTPKVSQSDRFELTKITSLLDISTCLLPSNQGCLALREPSDSEDSETEHCSKKDAPVVDLKLSTLESYHQLHGDGNSSQHSQNGTCSDRIKNALRNPECSCGKCSMPRSVLERCCKTFWGLPKLQQDAILWSLQSVEGDRSAKWAIEGHQLSC